MSSDQETQPLRLLGQVKWFNNKAGYGFITVNDGEYAGKDIFIHYSTIRVTNSQYKYLVQGEYVEFNLVKSTSDAHEYQAVDISGIKNGPLMCETRRRTRPPTTDAPERKEGVRRNKSAAPAESGDFTTVVSKRKRPQPRGKKESADVSTQKEV
jgi:cold shock CspA family protein